jgi:phage terminase large subunit-like protein
MAVTWEELIDRYKQAELIENEELYRYLIQPEVRESLISLCQVPGALQKRAVYTEVRRRCKTDLFWLARYFTWDRSPHNVSGDIKENIIKAETHKILCDFMLKKQPDKPISEQDPRRDRMLLYPRSAGKSTISSIDVVQYLLTWPHVRILYLTATDELANNFVEEVKGYFLSVPDEPSLMNIFFSEACHTGGRDAGAAGEYWQPQFVATGKKRREASLTGLGVECAISGRHFEVYVVDDAVNTENSSSEDSSKKVIKHFLINKKALLSNGYCNIIGTRYADHPDLYGFLLENSVGDIRKSTPQPNVDLIENVSTGEMFMIGRAISIKPSTAQKLEQEGRPITYKEAGPDGCFLLLPDIWSFQKLMQELNADEFVVESQLNNNPRPTGRMTFDRVLLESCTVDYRQVPTGGLRTQTWDFSFSQKKKRDFCVCSSCCWDDRGVCYVQDLIRDRFSPSALAQAVVDQIRKWRPIIVGIENAGGSKLLEPAIIAAAYRTNDPQVIAVASKIDWIDVDRSPDAKKTRMSALHPLLVEKRMLFSNSLPFLDTLYTEFERCLTSSAHDDIPDTLGYQPRYAAKVRSLVASQYSAPLSREDAIAQAQYNLLYGPWLGDSDYPADAYGVLGRGEQISVPMEPESPEPDFELEVRSQTPGVDSPLGSGLVG